MVIQRDKGRGRLSRNLLTREADYDTTRTRTFLHLHQIDTVEREMNIHKILHIRNTLVVIMDAG